MEHALIGKAKTGDTDAFARLVEPHRGELRAHCYRMSGSLHDADELLQETLVRAWQGLARFDGRASLRTWMYRIATNTCIDFLDARKARTLPAALGPAVASFELVGPAQTDPWWVEPCPATLYAEAPPTPEARYGQREAVALAFLVALQLLPPRPRAVLLLRDVLGFEASECAELLGVSVAAVKSALQRARGTLDAHAISARERRPEIGATTRALLARYVDAWERGDAAALVSLLHEDAALAMPPFRAWLSGARVVALALDAKVFKGLARHGAKLVATEANGAPAFAVYFRETAGGAFFAKAVQVIEVQGERVTGIMHFHDGSLVRHFGLSDTSQ